MNNSQHNTGLYVYLCGAGFFITSAAQIIFTELPFFWSILLATALSYLITVDLKEKRLPNWCTYFLITAGVAYYITTYLHLADPQQYLIQPILAILWRPLLGAFLGYGIIYGLRLVFLRLRSVEAIGLGDAKLLAATGAWLGPMAIPFILFLSSSLAILILLFCVIFLGKKINTQTQIPFGPFLAIAFWVMWSLYHTRIFPYFLTV